MNTLIRFFHTGEDTVFHQLKNMDCDIIPQMGSTVFLEDKEYIVDDICYSYPVDEDDHTVMVDVTVFKSERTINEEYRNI